MTAFLDNFLNPWGLLGLIMVPILIIIYIIKHRTREEVVSSTFIWKRAAKKTKRLVPINIRNLILIILQIAAITLVSLIIARPQLVASDTGEVIAIIDGSSSMMTVDENGVSRFDRAKQKVSDLAVGADKNHRVSVIVAGDEAKAICRREEMYLSVVDALDKCELTWGEADITNAIELARSIQQENTAAKIIYYTDTTYGATEGITTELVTANEWNAAVLGVSETRPAGAYSFKADVVSYGRDATLKVALYIDGEYVSSSKVDCKAGDKTIVDFTDSYKTTVYDYAEISIAFDKDKSDALSNDNAYYIYREKVERPHVQVAFAPDARNDFLLAVLGDDVIKQVVNIDGLTSEGYEDCKNGTVAPKIKYAGYSVYIFVGVLPTEMPQDGTVWLMNPPFAEGLVENVDGKDMISLKDKLGIDISYQGEKKYNSATGDKPYELMPGLTPNDAEFEILSGLTFLDSDGGRESVKVSSYNAITSGTYKSLLKCGNDTVMMVGKGDRHTRLIVSTILSSDFVLRPEYTLFISNVVKYATPKLFESGNFVVGDSIELTMPAGVDGYDILREQVSIEMVGSKEYVDPSLYDGKENTYQVADTEYQFISPGKYTMNMYISSVDLNGDPLPDGASVVTHNTYVSMSSSESDIYRTLATSLVVEPQEVENVSYEPEEIWLQLIIALLAVLMAEWWVYHHA